MANLTLESTVSIKDMVFWHLLILKMELSSFIKDEWPTEPDKSRQETAFGLLAKIAEQRSNFMTMVSVAFDDAALTQSITESPDWKTLDELITNFQTNLVVMAGEAAMRDAFIALRLPPTHHRMVAFIDPMKVAR